LLFVAWFLVLILRSAGLVVRLTPFGQAPGEGRWQARAHDFFLSGWDIVGHAFQEKFSFPFIVEAIGGVGVPVARLPYASTLMIYRVPFSRIAASRPKEVALSFPFLARMTGLCEWPTKAISSASERKASSASG